jgi:chromosome segregation ATPase
MFISLPKLLGSIALVAAITFAALPVAAQGAAQDSMQETAAVTSPDEVRAEISDAMDAITAYSEEQSEQAVTEARAALDRLDAEIEAREQAFREGWAEMSVEARETARDQLQSLRTARNRLGERFGALQAGTTSAWEELKSGFADAWAAFTDAWSGTDDDASAN